MSEAYIQFGGKCLGLLQSVPFGSLSKRELELGLLQAAIDAGLLEPQPVSLASSLQLSLTRANAYLNDLALRQQPLADADAIAALIALLPSCEAVAEDKHLSIPVQDAALRIWLERKLAAERLHPGESLRRDVVKLTPGGLLRLLERADGIARPAQALDALDFVSSEPDWLRDAKKSLDPTDLLARHIVNLR